MRRPSLSRLILALALSTTAACSSSPWSQRQAVSKPVAAEVAPGPASPAPVANATPTADAQAVDQLLAELERSQTIDAAARQQLAGDLLQTPAHLRPMVLQQFRAALAFRRQAEERETARAGGGRSAEYMAAIPASANAESPRSPQPTVGSPRPSAEGLSIATDRSPPLPSSPAASPPAFPSAGPPLPSVSLVSSVPQAGGPAPAVNAPRLGSQRPADSDAPERAAVSRPPQTGAPDAKQGTRREPVEPAGAVQLASHSSPGAPSDVPDGHLAEAIRALEQRLSGSPQSAEELADHARLRLLCLLANRRQDALRPIPGAPPQLQEVQGFWSNEIYGLAVWLDSQKTPDSARRAGEARRHLSDALEQLSEVAPLGIRNLAFVTEAQSFGNYRQCPKYEFAPEEGVLLYAEVENLKSEPTPKGYHSAWRSSYQIFDARGNLVSEQSPTASEEHCQNRRHDFFIGCRFQMPKRIYAGKHTLQLTVEDTNSRRVGQSSIDFTIKAGAND